MKDKIDNFLEEDLVTYICFILVSICLAINIYIMVKLERRISNIENTLYPTEIYNGNELPRV